MKKRLILAWSGWIMLQASSALAIQYSAGVREFYSAPTRHGFGGDAAAKMKMELGKLGIGSVTLHPRLGVVSVEGEDVFHPVQRTSRHDIDAMISRINHGYAVTSLKPMLFVNPRMGAPEALTLADPKDRARLFSSYRRAINLYLAIAKERTIDEFVVGSGMGQLQQSSFATQWQRLLTHFRSALSPQTALSIELSSIRDLENLESFFKEDASLFLETYSKLNKVRFTLPTDEIVGTKDLVVDQHRLRALLGDRIVRIRRLFPKIRIGLANVWIPGCSGFEAVESEVSCPAGAEVMSKAQAHAQAKALSDFFLVVESTPGVAADLESVEFMVATTQDEPLDYQGDPRYLISNPGAREILKQKFAPSGNFSTEFLSPSRAGLEPIRTSDKLACVYFDEADAKDALGPIHARLLENVIGAFPVWRTERRPVRGFVQGDLKDCESILYLATNYIMTPPVGFYEEMSSYLQSKPVAWFNYKFDRFLEVYRAAPKGAYVDIGFDVPRILQPDTPLSPSNPDPGFFRYFDFKGETFEKTAQWDAATGLYASSPELNEVQVKAPAKVTVLSTARHSKREETKPYIVHQKIQKGALFYIADLPFAFNHYEYPALIFCDVIWDILGETPKNHKPVALLRIEDVAPSVHNDDIRWTVDYLADRKIPHSLAVIPFYSDLFQNSNSNKPAPTWMPMDKARAFAGELRYAKARGSQFVFHGVAHQAGDLISGFSGTSGSDYEFWSWPDNKPISQDSSTFFIKQLELGEGAFRRLGIEPVAWEFPHYAGSALNSVLSGKLFEWNYHRGLYFKSEIVKSAKLGASLGFSKCNKTECREKRLKEATKLELMVDYRQFGTQVIPYPVYRDSYGQALIPETIGNVDFPVYSTSTWRKVTYPADLLRRAKKLRVIRGAMASFFWHPLLLDPTHIYHVENPGSYETIGGRKTLMAVVDGLQALGYEFRSIADCELFPRAACKTTTERTL